MINRFIFLMLFSSILIRANNNFPKFELFSKQHYSNFHNIIDIQSVGNKLYVLDKKKNGCSISILDDNETLLKTFSVDSCQKFYVTKKNLIFTTDSRKKEIKKFDLNGNLQLKWGEKGQSSGQFMTISDMFIDHLGLVHINDYGYCRIQAFNQNGDYIKKVGFVPFEGNAICFYNMLIDQSGYYYGNDSHDGSIIKVSSDGENKEKWKQKGKLLYISDNNTIFVLLNKQIIAFSTQGKELYRLNIEKYLSKKDFFIKVTVSEKGYLYWLDSTKGQIYKTSISLEKEKTTNFNNSITKQSSLEKTILPLLEKKLLRSASKVLKERIKKEPNNHEAYFYSGAILVEKEKYNLANQQLKKAITLNPSFIDAYYLLGILAEKQYDNDKALEYYKKCIEQDNMCSRARYRIGLILFDKELYNDGLKALKTAYAFPESLDHKSFFQLCLILGSHEAKLLKEPLGSDNRDLESIHDYLVAKKYRPYSYDSYNETLNHVHLVFLMNKNTLSENFHLAKKIL